MQNGTCKNNELFKLPSEGDTNAIGTLLFTKYQCRTQARVKIEGTFATTLDLQFRYLLPSFLSSFLLHHTGTYRFLALVVDLKDEAIEAMCVHFNDIYPNLFVEFLFVWHEKPGKYFSLQERRAASRPNCHYGASPNASSRAL